MQRIEALWKHRGSYSLDSNVTVAFSPVYRDLTLLCTCVWGNYCAVALASTVYLKMIMDLNGNAFWMPVWGLQSSRGNDCEIVEVVQVLLLLCSQVRDWGYIRLQCPSALGNNVVSTTAICTAKKNRVLFTMLS